MVKITFYNFIMYDNLYYFILGMTRSLDQSVKYCFYCFLFQSISELQINLKCDKANPELNYVNIFLLQVLFDKLNNLKIPLLKSLKWKWPK